MLLKGWIGELQTKFTLWISIGSNKYKRLHNLIIPSQNGTSQIDHLLVSEFGVFIIETKYRTGWIFGSKEQSTWTQTVYRRKYPFQNPLRQTYRQKKVLSEFLGIPDYKIHTVVYFVGNCRFKTRMPQNVIQSGLGRYIKGFKQQILTEIEVLQIYEKLSSHKSKSDLTSRDHRRSLKARHSSNTICPRCGSDLMVKTARRGKNIGSKFLGCKSYPRCRFTKRI